MLKWIALLLGALLAVAILVLLIVTWIESRQASELAGKQPYAPATTSSSRTAVVYFSRSGNTALAARHIAMRLDAQLFPLETPAYQLGPGGLTNDIDTAGFRGGILDVVNLDQQHPMMAGTGDLLERCRCIEQYRTGCAVATQALERDLQASWIDRFQQVSAVKLI